MFHSHVKAILLVLLLVVLAAPAWAQNTKGDKPSSSRESRFKKSDKKSRPLFGKRKKDTKGAAVRGKGYRVTLPKQKKGEQADRPVSSLNTSKPSKGDTRRFKSARVSPRSPSQSSRAIYKQNSRYANNPSPRPQNKQKAVSNRSTLSRLKRLQGPEPKPVKNRRVIPPSASSSFRTNKSINVMARYPRPKRKGEKATTKDISGRRIRTKNYQSPKPGIVNVQSGSLFGSSKNRRKRVDSQQFGRYKNFSSSRRVTRNGKTRIEPRSVSGKTQRSFSQSGAYVSNSYSKPKATQKAQSNADVLKTLKQLQSKKTGSGRRKPVITPRSASGSFMARRSPNMWARFPRPKRKAEQATVRDIAGKKLRTRNYRSPHPGLVPSANPYTGKKRVGERAYSAPTGGYSSATRSTQRAWRGDITGRRIHGKRTPRSNQSVGMGSNGYKSATRPGETRPGKKALSPKAPGLGYAGMKAYRGFLKGGRHGFRDQGEGFTGFFKSKRPLKGGGSRSGFWNNNGVAIYSKIPKRQQGEQYSGNIRSGNKGFRDQGEQYTGSIKARKPLKGGGSVSGKLWNNKGGAIATRIPQRQQGERYTGNIRFGTKGFRDQGEQYTGSIKARKPLKGGGSVSGKLWNNNQHAISPRIPKRQQGELFSGNIKTNRKPKGGGSVSGKLWNNDQRPIMGKAPARSALAINGFPGKMKRYSNQPGFNDQGEEYTGNIKARKPLKGGGSVSGKLWNNMETPINVRIPTGKNAAAVNGYPGKMKRFENQPGFNDQGEEYTGNIKLSGIFKKPYIKNPNASALAIKKKRPHPSTYEAGDLQVKVKQYHYIHNKSSAVAALKVREPGKAFARASAYQGNIKMQKFKLFDRNNLHPDAQFVKINKNNVASEKDAITNFKLWWSRLFRKEETQPDHLKEKGRKPRYDNGEKGLWYD